MKPADLAARLGRARFPLAAPTWPDSVPRPAPVRRIGLDYDHDWSRRYPVRLIRAVLLDNVTRPLTMLAVPTTVLGLEHLRHTEGPIIFVANHASHIDTQLLLTTLPVKFRHHTIVAAAADYFFDRTWKSALWSFSLAAIPIERSRVNRQSADVAAELLDDGWNMLIFPEGGRTPDGLGQPFRGGAAYLARRTSRPVIPVYLHNTRHVLAKRAEGGTRPPGGSGTEGRHGPGFRRTPVTIIFGAPLQPAEGEDARRFGVRIEAAVAALADEASTDWWSARQRAATASTPSLRGPEYAPWRRSWSLGPPPDGAGPSKPHQRSGRATRWPSS